jgi:colicin import membrane protein
MKKKLRRFEEGGGVGDDVRARAIRYAALAEGTEETPAQRRFIESVRRSQQEAAERPDPLANIIKAGLEREKERSRPKPSPMTQVIIEEAKRREKDPNAPSEFTEPQKLEPAPWGITIPYRKRTSESDEVSSYMSGSEGEDRGPTTRQIEARQRAQGLQGVYPEAMLAGRGLGTVAAAAKRGIEALASRRNEIEDAASKVFTRPQPREMRESEAMRAARERREAAVKAAQERRKAAAEARKARDLNRMENEAPGQITPRMNPRQEARPPRDVDESRMAGEGFGFKKGGKIKFASGGSASARADGIAKRGKTKCRIF